MLRVGVVGAGAMGKVHLEVLSALPHVRVQALVEPQPSLREAVGQTHRIARLHESLDSLLDSGDADAVCLATPPAQHFRQALQVLTAGLPLLIEKPLCLDLEEADELVLAGRDHTVLVGHNLRHHRLVAQARALIPELGPVTAIRTASAISLASIRSSPWRHGPEGHLLSELGVHHFDVLRALLGLRIDEARVYEGNGNLAYQARAGNVPISCQFLYSDIPLNQLEIDFEQGRLHLDFFRFDGLSLLRPARSQRLASLRSLFSQLPDYWRQSRPYGGDFRASYRQQWRHFLSCIGSSQECRASLEDGREALRCGLLSTRDAAPHANDAAPSAIFLSGRT